MTVCNGQLARDAAVGSKQRLHFDTYINTPVPTQNIRTPKYTPRRPQKLRTTKEPVPTPRHLFRTRASRAAAVTPISKTPHAITPGLAHVTSRLSMAKQ